MKPLTRGQVAASSGLDIETVRFCEQQALIVDPPRSEAGYRQYSAENVSQLRFIKRAKELGFSLKEVSDLLALQGKPDVSCVEVRMQAEAKLAGIEGKIRELIRMKAALFQLTQACSGQGTTEGCSIMEALNQEATHDHRQAAS